MKKSIFILSLILILTMVSAVSFAQGEVVIRIDSSNVVFDNLLGTPFIDLNNRTLVPFRVTLESYGAEVNWNSETRTAIAKKGDITIEVPIGENFILKNGEKIENDTAAVIKEEKTYLPIRKVIEAFGSEVQWDEKVKTVVITTEPIDGRKMLMDAYAKSYEWENYNMDMLMNMSMVMPSELGVGKMDMVMNMDMTAFMKPMKVKAIANMEIDMGGEKMSQPLMEMYYAVEDDKFTTYIGMYDETGKITWVKSEVENELFTEMLDYDLEKNMELNEKSIKDVRFLGKYTDKNGRTVLKLENTTSFEAYNEIMGGYLNILSSSAKEEDLMAMEMLKNMDDITFVIYVDELTREIVSYEMDLSSFMKSILSSMSGDEAIPAEALEIFNNLEMTMEMDVMNINKAEKFEIPKEALNAPLAESLLEEEATN